MRLLTVVLVLYSSKFAFSSEPIIGGREVGSDDPVAQSTVGLVGMLSNGEEFICTGSIIEQDLVLTAGHCVADAAKIGILFSREMKGQSPSVAKKLILHPDYRGQGGFFGGKEMNDIALVQFDGGLPVGYSPIELIASTEAIQRGEKVAVAGYGVTRANDSSGKTAGTLRKAMVAIEDANYSDSEFTLNQMHGRGSCFGDSGGPVLAPGNSGMMELIGITSRGSDDCAAVNIFTNLKAFLPWIAQERAQLHQ
ncbi:MAG: S1 family peptidase [Bdellovibrionota bacterium]